jgi:hypothetical protein
MRRHNAAWRIIQGLLNALHFFGKRLRSQFARSHDGKRKEGWAMHQISSSTETTRDALRVVRLENEWIDLSILPEVGAKILSLFGRKRWVEGIIASSLAQSIVN